MSVFDLAADALEHLNNLLKETYELNPNPEHLRKAFIFRHARFVSEIAADMALLYSHGQYAAASIAVRSMLESCFCANAAVKNETFAAERVIGESKESIRRLRSIYKKNPSQAEAAIKVHEALMEQAKKDTPGARERDWSICQIAELSSLEGFYILYYFHCLTSHATVGGMISHEYESTIGTVLETAIIAIITTAAGLTLSLETKAPQESVDRCSKMLEQLTAFSSQGVFEELNEAKERART